MKQNINIDALPVRFLIIDDYGGASRRIRYKAQDDGLPWWKRNFIFNPWKKVYMVSDTGVYEEYFTLWEFTHYIKLFKTVGEVKNYIAEQDEKYNDVQNRWRDR